MSSEEMKQEKRMDKLTKWSILGYCTIITIITFLTLIIPVKEDDTIHHFPFMVYVPYTISIIGLLLLILHSKYSTMKYLSWYPVKVEFKTEFGKYEEITQKITAGLIIVVTALLWVLSIPDLAFLISPMNFIYDTFILSMILIWLSISIDNPSRKQIAILLTILIVNLVLMVTAILIAGDELVLPLVLSYQIIALIVLIVKFFSIE